MIVVILKMSLFTWKQDVHWVEKCLISMIGFMMQVGLLTDGRSCYYRAVQKQSLLEEMDPLVRLKKIDFILHESKDLNDINRRRYNSCFGRGYNNNLLI